MSRIQRCVLSLPILLQILLLAGGLVAVLAGCAPAAAEPRVIEHEASAEEAARARVARGEYLVKSVAMCADCHSKRLPGGHFDEKRWLMGSVLEFAPMHEMPAWAGVAPAIAGLPGWSDEQAVHLLTSGVAPSGRRPAPPMPPYAMSREDAEAVVAYLRSLAPSR